MSNFKILRWMYDYTTPDIFLHRTIVDDNSTCYVEVGGAYGRAFILRCTDRLCIKEYEPRIIYRPELENIFIVRNKDEDYKRIKSTITEIDETYTDDELLLIFGKKYTDEYICSMYGEEYKDIYLKISEKLIETVYGN